MKPIYLKIAAVAIFFTCIYSNCSNTGGQTEYVVTNIDPTNFDVALTGKTVGINVTAPAGYHTTQVLISSWLAGHNTGMPAETFSVDFNGNFTFSKPLRGSAGLGVCEAMYFMFTTVYTKDGHNGTFIGQPKMVMPTKEIRNGQISQATCSEPPGPDVNNP